MAKPLSVADTSRCNRLEILRQAMRPADVTDDWQTLRRRPIAPEQFHGLTRIETDHPQEEAQAIALVMRRALETPGKTAMLVTPDRELAERVCAALGRWNIAVNDSAGASLAGQPVGAFLRDLLSAAAPDAGAVAWLSLLKHPFAACGLDPADCRTRAREIERMVWRAEEPQPSGWLTAIRQMLTPLTSAWQTRRSLTDWIDTHIGLAETLAASDIETGAARLWRDATGEAAAEWLDDVRRAAAGFPALTASDYVGLFSGLLRGMVVRPAYGRHPRLNIFGPLEARLLQADITILGGLNEGTWPSDPPVDPWLSRPMKTAFGLPSPERRIGLAAHDFVQLACGSAEVYLTRARRVGTAPAVPSRFLLQIETVLKAYGLSDNKRDALASPEPWQDWAQCLDAPDKTDRSAMAAPRPCPPVAARPTSLSVTKITVWRRNPYAIYAQYILGLRKLPALDAELDAADRGKMIHAALEQFIKAYPKQLPAEPYVALCAIGREVFAPVLDQPEIAAFWWPRFEKIAAWFVANEAERRAKNILPIRTEISGHVMIDRFKLTGRADRVDALPSGVLEIIDYKTGKTPTKDSVKSGAEPQLPLLALIAQEGGFKNLPPADVGAFDYWRLTGGQKIDGPSKIDETGKDVAALIAAARADLEKLIAAYADPAMPYLAVPIPGLAPDYDDYAHLARLSEWGRTEADR